MAPSKRSYDLKKNQRTHELVSRLESEVKSMKAPLPTMVPRRDAQRLWGFTEKDLKLIDSSAILSSKRGQRGIYYSELDLRALQDQIDMSSLVEPDMIPEVVIRSLMSVRPPWILLPSNRYALGCLCDICQNISLLLRYINY